MRPIIVVDTSVLVAGLLSARGRSREVLRGCLTRRFQPLIGTAMLTEFEAVLSREELFEDCPVSVEERQELFDALLSRCRWIHVYYLWRPNLPDEGDNHVLELAVAGGAEAIVTNNVRDFRRSELHFPGVSVLTPDEFLKRVEAHDNDDDQNGR